MSTALSSFWYGPKSARLISGGDTGAQPTLARQLEEQFGPPAAPGEVDGLDELFEELETWLSEGEDDD